MGEAPLFCAKGCIAVSYEFAAGHAVRASVFQFRHRGRGQ